MEPRSLAIGGIFSEAEWAGLIATLGVSSQQARIAVLLMEGAGDKEIAHKLGISVPTVRTYLGRMFSKLTVQDRNELIVGIFRGFRAGCDLAKCHHFQCRGD